MIILISPAKTLDFETPVSSKLKSEPRFAGQSQRLVNHLKKKSPRSLKKLMDISDDLAALNHERYQSWSQPADSDHSKPAVFAFKGDVYLGLQAEKLNENDLEFAQDHLRILSGLHGILRPMDLILPYRLEMGTALKVTPKLSNLYKFWGDSITRELLKDLESTGSKAVVNLASEEYFKVIKSKLVDHEIITPAFYDWKNGEYKMIGYFAKKARGTMAAFAIRNKITNPEQLKLFNEENYSYNDRLTQGNKWIFTRENKE